MYRFETHQKKAVFLPHGTNITLTSTDFAKSNQTEANPAQVTYMFYELRTQKILEKTNLFFKNENSITLISLPFKLLKDSNQCTLVLSNEDINVTTIQFLALTPENAKQFTLSHPFLVEEQ